VTTYEVEPALGREHPSPRFAARARPREGVQGAAYEAPMPGVWGQRPQRVRAEPEYFQGP